jgi:hypothetical protein
VLKTKRLAILMLLVCGGIRAATGRIFPEPREITLTDKPFLLAGAAILTPADAPASDRALARSLAQELSDRWDVQLPIRRAAEAPAGGRSIVVGVFTNPLVSALCAREHIQVTASSPGAEGYVLRVEPNLILIAGSDERGAFYGFQSLRQLIARGPQGAVAAGASVRDWPAKPFRGVKLFLPGRANIPFFKRFIRDYMALYKFNKLTIEMNASMRLDRHPELNAGWVDFFRDTNYSRRNYPPDPAHGVQPNSSHQDTADGGFLEKSEVADLARWVRDNHIEMIPEIPSLTHSYYLLSRHKDLAEVSAHKWPDTFCPLLPGSYKLLFEVLDEYIEVLKPSMIHMGHDEWFTGMDECPRCKGKDWGELYGMDVKKAHDYLAARGIKMAIWGDMLLQGVRGKEPRTHKTGSGYQYRSPAALSPEQVRKYIAKDILIFNWFWSGRGEQPQANEAQLEEFGFKQVYGNMEPTVPGFDQRIQRATILGGAPSSWAATTEANFGKDMLWSIMGTSSMLWTGRAVDTVALSNLMQARMPETRLQLTGEPAPSETEQSASLDISPAFNMGPREDMFAVDLSGVKAGEANSGRVAFALREQGGKSAVVVGTEGKQPNPLPREVNRIPVGVDASSLIFLHAAARPATNKLAYRLIWDVDDSADMLGWYEVVYEDGFVQVVPVRYGVNILEWNWKPGKTRTEGADYCYAGDAVPLGNATFFAYEWKNPRLGKVIKEVRLKGTTGFRGAVPGYEDTFGEVIPNNAVILKAISYTKAR